MTPEGDEELERLVDKVEGFFEEDPAPVLTPPGPAPWPEGKVPIVKWVDPREPQHQKSPLEERLRGVALMLHDGRLTEADAVKALYRTLGLLSPVVERLLACSTCRRVFCAVRMHEAVFVEPVCPGCEREGR